jgi:hypothetical protein
MQLRHISAVAFTVIDVSGKALGGDEPISFVDSSHLKLILY